MVLGLKPMGKPSTEKNISFGQNLGLAWSSDSSLRGNQILEKVLDRTKALHSPRTQAYGETKYWKKLWIEPKHCMVLGLRPTGTPTTRMRKVLGSNTVKC